ncbi:LysR family transcriptional regulator [Vitreoscilla massiliensis]|uniref:LysR family transcriptional regulator n=1 Tax=Vitreoscilla massiliensis TaxID=1689272 RepID=A0ABY4E2U4_9NEIS|nr:LysR family transcriptional regulator [Vitreoscilla massiliensis]UOO90091.1 LysR family transcriptional regulator [Vitreoscilla massiliensis]
MNSKNIRALNYLYYFFIVAKQGSISKSAEQLAVTQGAISKQIVNLEQILGVQLFKRESRGVSLTQEGRILYESISPCIDVIFSAFNRIQNQEDSNVIKIICTEAVAHYWLAPITYQFSEDFPNINIHITSSNAISAEVIEAYDFGILYGNGQWDALNTFLLFQEKISPICHIDYPVEDIKTINDLMKHKLIQLDPYQWRWITWQEWMKINHSQYHPQKDTLVYNQVTLALAACTNKQGIALGWEFMVKDLVKNNILKKISQFETLTGMNDYLVNSKYKKLSSHAQIFRDWLIASIK